MVAGGGGSSGDPGGEFPAVSDLNIIPAEGSLLLNWTNPNRIDISDFNISWVSTSATGSGTGSGSRLTGDQSDQSALTMTGYLLDGLTDGTGYTVSVSVLYAGGGLSNVVSGPMRRPGKNTDGDHLPDNEDPDDDNDGLNDFAEDGSTPLDACPRGDTGWTSNASADNDGDGCRDAHAEDADDDNDGVPDTTDNCPLVVNALQENSDLDAPGDACGDTDDNGTPNVADPDDDGDGVADAADVDDDGDGLIEVRTLDDLGRMRDDLNGNGGDDSHFTDVVAMGSSGCPTPGGCTGYELVRSLNFSDAGSYETGSASKSAWTNRSGRGWVPIGFCSVDKTSCTDLNRFFQPVTRYRSYTGTFEGNGHGLYDLFINASTETSETMDMGGLTVQILSSSQGIGLFGAIANNEIRNLRLVNAYIKGGLLNIGMVAGVAKNSVLRRVAAEGAADAFVNSRSIGGLVGGGLIDTPAVSLTILSSYAVLNLNKTLPARSSFNTASETFPPLNSNNEFSDASGGLVGAMSGSLVIRSSYAFGNVITTRAEVGGLVGRYSYSAPLPNTCEITGSYAALRLTADNSVGGILGTVRGGTCRLTASYSASVPKGAAGKSDIGGLRGSLFVGSANNIHGNVSVNATYWDATLPATRRRVMTMSMAAPQSNCKRRQNFRVFMQSGTTIFAMRGPASPATRWLGTRAMRMHIRY